MWLKFPVQALVSRAQHTLIPHWETVQKYFQLREFSYD